MGSRKSNPERACSCGSGRKWKACHGLPESKRPKSCARSQPRRYHDPLTPAELLEVSQHGPRGFSSSALSELAGGLLHGIYLAGTDLGSSNFQDADLTQAYLYGCDLWAADFRGADLRGASLNQSQLTAANFGGANLQDAGFPDAVLNNANFEGVDLRNVRMHGTSLRGANLANADLRGAMLGRADLTGANISNARCDGVRLDGTLLVDLDITPLATSSVVHAGPSFVDDRTVVHSLRAPGLKEFLQRVGMPEVFVEYMIDCARSLSPGGVFRMLQSTFISYGGPDTDFAQKLYEALHRNGVTTFFFPVHAVPGKKLHRTMYEGVNNHDRMILICSQASLDRPGVLNEIEKVLERETRDGGKEYLIPIRLDDYLFSKKWKPANADVAQALRDRVVADFRSADSDDAKFNEGLLRLIAALRKIPAPTAAAAAPAPPKPKKTAAPASTKPAAKAPSKKKTTAKKTAAAPAAKRTTAKRVPKKTL